ncbi:uncharacterized protein ACDL77_004268 [Rhynchocyon petersi]
MADRGLSDSQEESQKDLESDPSLNSQAQETTVTASGTKDTQSPDRASGLRDHQRVETIGAGSADTDEQPEGPDETTDGKCPKDEAEHDGGQGSHLPLGSSESQKDLESDPSLNSQAQETTVTASGTKDTQSPDRASGLRDHQRVETIGAGSADTDEQPEGPDETTDGKCPKDEAEHDGGQGSHLPLGSSESQKDLESDPSLNSQAQETTVTASGTKDTQSPDRASGLRDHQRVETIGAGSADTDEQPEGPDETTDGKCPKDEAEHDGGQGSHLPLGSSESQKDLESDPSLNSQAQETTVTASGTKDTQSPDRASGLRDHQRVETIGAGSADTDEQPEGPDETTDGKCPKDEAEHDGGQGSHLPLGSSGEAWVPAPKLSPSDKVGRADGPSAAPPEDMSVRSRASQEPPAPDSQDTQRAGHPSQGLESPDTLRRRQRWAAPGTELGLVLSSSHFEILR